jgi:hypothetical protein
MASGQTSTYDLPFPLSTDPVDVHGDIQSLAEAIDLMLPEIVGVSYHTLEVRNVSGVSITKGDPVYISGYSTKPTIAKANASTIGTFPVVGLAQSNIGNSTDGVIIVSGVFSSINTNSYTAGNVLYVAAGGGLTATKPASNVVTVGVVAKSDSTTGVIIVTSPRSRASTWGALKEGLL